jgi:hypothetical protein
MDYQGEIKTVFERGKTDIVFFAKYICRCDTELYKAGKSKFGDLHPDCIKWLLNSNKHENLLHAANRWFKSGSQAIKFLHKIVYNDNDPRHYRMANVAISAEQSTVIFNKTLDLFKNSILPQDMLLSVVYHPQPTALFARYLPPQKAGDKPTLDKLEFWARTTQNKGKYLEGFDFRYINFDEPALEQHLEFLRDEVLIPRTGDYDNGQIDYTATPKGFGPYYQLKMSLQHNPTAYVQGGRVAQLIEPATLEELSLYRETGKDIKFAMINPYVSSTYIATAFRYWPIDKIRQVIYGEFISTASNPFAQRIIDITDYNAILQRHAIPNHLYISAWDLARGKKRASDKTVGITVDISVNPWLVVDHESFQLPWVDQDESRRGVANDDSIEGKIRKRALQYPGTTIIDGTGIGDTMSEILSDIAEVFIFKASSSVGMSKEDAIINAQTAMDMRLITTPPIQELIDECTYYQLADEGLETDNVMALVILLSRAEVSDYSNQAPTKYIPKG